MSDKFGVDYSEMKNLQQVIENFGNNAYKVVNDVLHSESADIIKNNIQLLLPSSGRKWRGKGNSAISSKPFRADKSELLTITIRTKTAYNYLYFPDDGTNTDHHKGEQHFMEHGADNSLSRISKLCVSKLIENFNNS